MILFLFLAALLVVGAPLFVVMGIAALVAFYLYVPGYDEFLMLDIVIRKMEELTNQNVFLAIPFFVLSGSIMSAGGISRRLIALADALVGQMRGGLAISAVGACVIFAAISGSAPVTLIAIGGLMYPALVKAGYSERFSMGLVTTSGSLGMLIPPSVPMLIYAISVTGSSMVNVGDLFLAGLGPGLVVSGMLALYAFIFGAKKAEGRKFEFAKVRVAFREGIWSLMLPVMILGGIYGGLFTPTEAAAVSVPYALFVEFVIHREIKINQLPGIVLESVQALGALVMIIMLSMSLNHFMVEKGLGEAALEVMKGWGLGPIGFLVAMNVFLIGVGMLMDSISAIVLFTPLLVPVAVGLGLDPLHVGIVFIINMEIGYLTPPVGANLFVAATQFKQPFGEVIRSVVPTMGILAAGLLMVTYIPSIATGPVYALRGEAFWRPISTLENDDAPVAPIEDEPDEAPSVAGKVLSLEEMMKQAAKTQESDPEEGKVLSLEEMMKQAKASQNAEPADAPPAPKEGRVMSLEEMMKAAKEQSARPAADLQD